MAQQTAYAKARKPFTISIDQHRMMEGLTRGYKNEEKTCKRYLKQTTSQTDGLAVQGREQERKDQDNAKILGPSDWISLSIIQ